MRKVLALMAMFILAVSWTGSPPWLSAQVVGDSVTLSWIPPTEGTDNLPLLELSGYHLYESATSGGPYAEIAAPPPGSTSYVVTSLSEGDHHYVITAWNSAGESDFSNEVAVTVNGVVVRPKAPGSLAANR